MGRFPGAQPVLEQFFDLPDRRQIGKILYESSWRREIPET
jgi:hypothetical protein